MVSDEPLNLHNRLRVRVWCRDRQFLECRDLPGAGGAFDCEARESLSGMRNPDPLVS